MGRVWETAERRDLATSLALRDGRGEGGPARGHVPSQLRAIAGRKPRDETRPSGGEIAEKRLYGAECPGIGMLPAERSSMKVYIYLVYIYKGASRREALAACRFARRLHAMSSAVVVFAIYRVVGGN